MTELLFKSNPFIILCVLSILFQSLLTIHLHTGCVPHSTYQTVIEYTDGSEAYKHVRSRQIQPINMMAKDLGHNVQ